MGVPPNLELVVGLRKRLSLMFWLTNLHVQYII